MSKKGRNLWSHVWNYPEIGSHPNIGSHPSIYWRARYALSFECGPEKDTTNGFLLWSSSRLHVRKLPEHGKSCDEMSQFASKKHQ